jgi:hypothetical protein
MPTELDDVFHHLLAGGDVIIAEIIKLPRPPAT